MLLNCYTKTSDRARLDAFIKNEAKRDAGADELPFDLDTAIRVCRQAGFFEHATYLARKYGRHEDYLRIQIEDAEEYKDALRYLRSLGPEACEENLVHYGRSLLHHEPEATTDLLIDLCSGNLGRKTTHQDMHPDSRANGSGPAVLSYLGVNRLFGADNQNSGGPATPNGAPTDPSTPEAESPLDEEPSYIPPSPRHFFPHFIDHHSLFVHFLEDVAYSLWGQKVDAAAQRTNVPIPRREENDSTDPALSDQRSVWNTLLELYLDDTNSSDASVASTARSKVISLLGSGDSIPFDPMHALVLCSMAGFTDGLVGLWESMGMYEDALRYWMEKAAESPDHTANGNAPDPGSEVFRYLDVYGPTNLSLYPLVLRWMTSSPAILSKYQDRLSGILATIDEERIIPPLAVVQLLSRNGVASVGLVKDWLRSKVDETKNEIEAVSSHLRGGEFKLTNPGQVARAVVPLRDSGEGAADREPDEYEGARSVPGDAVCGVRGAARPSLCPLHVQAQLPPAVSLGLGPRVHPVRAAAHDGARDPTEPDAPRRPPRHLPQRGARQRRRVRCRRWRLRTRPVLQGRHRRLVGVILDVEGRAV